MNLNNLDLSDSYHRLVMPPKMIIAHSNIKVVFDISDKIEKACREMHMKVLSGLSCQPENEFLDNSDGLYVVEVTEANSKKGSALARVRGMNQFTKIIGLARESTDKSTSIFDGFLPESPSYNDCKWLVKTAYEIRVNELQSN